ncbi:MAG: 30S ribosomal protein S4 [Proteobacteria bacterium]|nr:30S ribosomal protein S4 [Pseudomonadota bacterium]
MARYSGPACRLCRRELKKLFLKGSRCYTDKCAFERRGYPPGQHGWSRVKVTDYGTHLREKQRVKRTHSLAERQFRRYFQMASRQTGATGENLLVILEIRLDSTIFHLGFARTRAEARQLVMHGHFQVNGRKVDIPSYQVKAQDVIEVREKSRKMGSILDALEMRAQRGLPAWLEQDREKFRGVVKSHPRRDDIHPDVLEQLIVEYYSR